jgi:hypothetical protein
METTSAPKPVRRTMAAPCLDEDMGGVETPQRA